MQKKSVSSNNMREEEVEKKLLIGFSSDNNNLFVRVSAQMTLAVRFWTSILTAAAPIEIRPLFQSLHTY